MAERWLVRTPASIKCGPRVELRFCAGSNCGRSLVSDVDIDRLVQPGVPAYIRSDNGPEFTAKKVTDWLKCLEVKTLFIEPGSPWENGYNESFNGTLRYELLDVEWFDTLLEAKVLIERWRKIYNTLRPHSSLGYRPPAPEAILPRKESATRSLPNEILLKENDMLNLT